MHPIIKPAFFLMNHLSYRGKFMLICSVFAIPLAVFAFKLATSYHQQADQALVTKQGLIYIQKTNLLILELENLRDLKVISSWNTSPKFAQLFNDSRTKSIQHVQNLIKASNKPANEKFLSELAELIQSDEKAAGIESGSIDAVYEDAQSILDKVYKWRSKLSYNFISFTRNNSHILSIINLLNESELYTRSLGKARTYGSLYLAQQFVDSYGGQVLEKTYQELTNLINLIELKNSEYKPLFQSYQQADLIQIKESLLKGREHLYKKLILATETTSDPVTYFENLSASFEQIHQYNQSLFDLSSAIVEENYSLSLQQLSAFYISALFISLLITYLALGLYHSISVTIRELRRSAAFYSAGKYDKPVKVTSKDELTAVAEAMNNMRVNIKEREEKLAKMSQTDGLTKLSNRKFFDQALDISLANSRRNLTPVSLVMMDIDFFKKVNDTYGHLAGDECLIKIAELMTSQFKRQTDVVARYGGEEFIAILYGQTLQEAEQQTEKLRLEIESTTIITSEHEFSVTASFGITCLTPPQTSEAQDLIALADSLLYQSKESGRNRITAKTYQPEQTN